MDEQIQCPICMVFLDKQIIENHVNECLKPKKDTNKVSPKFFGKSSGGSQKREFISQGQETPSPPMKKKKVTTDIIDTIHTNNEKHLPKKTIVLGKIPLAEQMRPTSFQEYFSSHIGKEKDFLIDVLNSGIIPSMLFWGPPGCGKTSLANVISNLCKINKKMRFVTLSATSAGVSDVKEVVKVAKNERRLTQRKTILFIDEVHRFNKLQQDTFLPHVEDGTITLLGATTENPSFHVNNALISRCRVVMMSALNVDDVEKILTNAVSYLGGIVLGTHVGQDTHVVRSGDHDTSDAERPSNETDSLNEGNNSKAKFKIQQNALKLMSSSTNGDARVALNSLDIILQAKLSNHGCPLIKAEEVEEEIRRNYVNYDKKGDEHYDIISALHKSIRGSDENAAMYWLARMLEGGEQPLYIARRLVRCASEDIGLADPAALQQAVSGYQACHFIGMPECNVILAQVVTYLSRAKKSIEVYEAYNEARALIKSWKGAQPTVPLHLRNAPTKLMEEQGYGRDYKYTPKCLDNPEQDYLPKELITKKFFH